MELGLQIKQSQTLSPQMVQAMEILQMNNQELEVYIQEAQLENPLLEVQTDASDDDPRPEPTPVTAQWEWDGQNSAYDRQDWDDRVNRPSFDRADRPVDALTLTEYLYSQCHLEGALDEAVYTIIESLDHRGYLEEDLVSLSARTAIALELLEEGLQVVQAMVPAGVGAVDLQQCLELQLMRMGQESALAQQLVMHHLPQLAQNHYHAISQELDVPREDIERAVTLIRGLNPKPGAAFGGWGTVNYVVPDVFVVQEDEGLVVRLRDGNLPPLTLNQYYRSLLADEGDAAVQDYLGKKLKQANWLIQGISQRKETLMRCATFIVNGQLDFFEGQGAPKPMLLRDGAEALGIHESTVSRALRNKYLQCSRGVFPLSYFFSRNVGGEEQTALRIQSRMRELIQNEDKKKPYSDQKICVLLGEEGIALSRRTVAKYREEMHIPAASGRKILGAGGQ